MILPSTLLMKRGSKPIFLYADGACSVNPGPGGYGVILKCGEFYKELSGAEMETTNNRMELTAVIEGLKAIKWEGADVQIYSDSKYVVSAVNEGWLKKWIANDFKGKKNRDLWMEFYTLSKKFALTLHWIKGHNKHPENERCDKLANGRVKELKFKIKESQINGHLREE